jgi:glycine cleavage system regulatory protein
VIEQITANMLESRIESIAALLTLIFAATASLEKVRLTAEQLAASPKRRVLLLLMIRELTERDMELAKQVALMLPANHPALLWAFGEELAEVHDRLVSDLGNPGICSEVLFFMKPPEE